MGDPGEPCAPLAGSWGSWLGSRGTHAAGADCWSGDAGSTSAPDLTQEHIPVDGSGPTLPGQQGRVMELGHPSRPGSGACGMVMVTTCQAGGPPPRTAHRYRKERGLRLPPAHSAQPLGTRRALHPRLPRPGHFQPPQIGPRVGLRELFWAWKESCGGREREAMTGLAGLGPPPPGPLPPTDPPLPAVSTQSGLPHR